MTARALRFEPPLMLAAGLLALPLALALLLVVPAGTTVDVWAGLMLGPGVFAILLTAVVLAVALALTTERFVGQALDAVLFVGTPLLVALTFWAFSIPGTYFFVAAMLSLVWVLLALLWLGRFAYLLGRRRLGKAQIGAWLALPVIVVAAAIAVSLDAPARARFELSRPAMDRAARDVLAGRRDPSKIHRIGLWEVDRAERVGPSFRFLVKESGLFDSIGFAYSTRGEPPYVGEDSYWHVEGPWYVWQESW